jgi:hypothetical protein
MPAQLNCTVDDPRAAPSLTPFYCHPDRRGKQRIELPFPVVVRSVERDGRCFRMETALDNLSSTGLYVRVVWPMEPGATVFVVVRLSTTPACQVRAPNVAAHGRVVRAERRPGGAWGIAVVFTHHRFLYAPTSRSTTSCSDHR